MKTVILAEKPSQAKAYAETFKKGKSRKVILKLVIHYSQVK